MAAAAAAAAAAKALAEENAQLRRIIGEMRREVEALHVQPNPGQGAQSSSPPPSSPGAPGTPGSPNTPGTATSAASGPGGSELAAVQAERDQLLEQRNKLMALSNELKRDLKRAMSSSIISNGSVQYSSQSTATAVAGPGDAADGGGS